MLKRLESVLLEVATVSVVALAVLIFADVLAVNFFQSYVPDTIVIVRELMILAIVLPLAAATANRSHIAVEFVTNLLPEKVVNWFVAFGTIFSFFVLLPIIWVAYQDLAYQLQIQSTFYGDLNLPKWPGRMAFLIGIVLCWIRLGTLILVDIRAAVRGAPADTSDHQS